MKKIYILSFILATIFLMEACQTGKKAFEQGNYYQSVMQSVDKLRKNPNNKKARVALADAYPLAIQTIDLNTQNMLKSNDASKWKIVLGNYEKVNRMYEEILRSPEALRIIGTPKNYYNELEAAKKNAAEEVYTRAMTFLQKGTREDAKIAYRLFKESQSYIPNYKDTNDRIEEARVMATLYVMVNQDPVPEKFAVSGNHFRNKIDEFLHSSEARMNFIEFYNPKEMIALGIQPDHEIVLRYQEFNIGNVFQKESTQYLVKDSVVVATYERDVPLSGSTTSEQGVTSSTRTTTQDAKGGVPGSNNTENQKVVICHKVDENTSQTIEISMSALQAHLDHGDAIGPCNDSGGSQNTGGSGSTGGSTTSPKGGDTGSNTGGNTGSNQGGTTTPGKETVNVYATVKATLVVNEKTVTSTASLAMTIYETNRAGRVLRQDMIPVEYVWKSQWGYFNGDERALTEEQLQITKSKEQQPPDRDEMFNLLAEQFYYRVTENIQAFYKNY